MMISAAALAPMMASAAVYATGQRKTLTRLLHSGRFLLSLELPRRGKREKKSFQQP
jgi:hypothetical protein